ncbi:hypothetical protein ACFQVA_11765 [Actinomadura keratinilytica]
MAISLSVVVLLAIVMVVLIRGGSLRRPAVVAILFGFFLASSGMAPAIQRVLDSIAQTVSGISF